MNGFSDLFCTRGGNRTRTLLPELDFESSASTNSATRASYLCLKLVRKTNYFNGISKILFPTNFLLFQ
jgi:hypothetical protein